MGKQVEKIYKKANTLTDEEIQIKRKHKLDLLWSKINHITVQCYHCGQIQNARTIRTKKCINCNRQFTIVSRGGGVNRAIYHCKENWEKRYYILQIIELTFGGRISQIL